MHRSIGSQPAGFSGFLDQSRDPFILGSDAHGEIDNENAKISSANTPFGAHDAENLSRTRMSSAPANSGRVDKNEGPAVALVKNVDRVACCAGQLAYNRTFAADDGIDQRRFTNVRPTDDRDRDWTFSVR